MQYVQLPSHLQKVFFETRWETAKQTPVTSLSLSELDWHLDLTVWSTVSGEPRFDLAPRRVLAEPSVYPRRWARIRAASLAYPLELFLRNERWVIVDGYHPSPNIGWKGRSSSRFVFILRRSGMMFDRRHPARCLRLLPRNDLRSTASARPDK